MSGGGSGAAWAGETGFGIPWGAGAWLTLPLDRPDDEGGCLGTGGIALPLECNVGGPMSRTRTERIRSTVLGPNPGPIRMSRVLSVALDFEGDDPLEVAGILLRSVGLGSPEGLRDLYPLPPGPCICRVNPFLHRLPVLQSTPDRVLECAQILGLSTPYLYDPARPALWTQASLTRALQLFSPEGFYA